MAVKKMNRYVTLLLTLLLSLAVGFVFMLILGYQPLDAYLQLFRGAFIGSVNLGTTLQKFAPILLTGIGFAVAAKVGCFNAGIEGELYLGAMAAALTGHYIKGLPAPLHLLICFLAAIIVGDLWAAIPALLKVKWGVNEIAVCILAGAWGNMIDRLRYAYVVDFFYFKLIDFPIFNVADIYVTTAVILLLVLVLFYYKEEELDFIGRKK